MTLEALEYSPISIEPTSEWTKNVFPLVLPNSATSNENKPIESSVFVSSLINETSTSIAPAMDFITQHMSSSMADPNHSSNGNADYPEQSTPNTLSLNLSTSSLTLPFAPYFSSSPTNSLFHYEDEPNEEDLVLQYFKNRALDTPSLITLGTVYAVLIFIGAFGNGLVCLAVARQPKMRTSRNLFIINLAISDLLLCFFTIPFSLVEISTKFWPYGVTMCKLVVALEATSIFVSTLSITAIALDRYQVILHSMNAEQSRKNHVPHVFKLLLIWVIGMLLALPLFMFRTVESHHIGFAEIDTIKFCIEKWPIQHGRGYYSVLSMLIQYVVPITIVTVVYTRLCMKLRSRTLRRTSTTQLPKLRTRLQRRARKTNLLLIAIALIFCISWLPLNVLNIVADLSFPFNSDRSFRITFAVCHMAGMSSSCSNPFLYGWLNQNFRNEFQEIFISFKRCFMRVFMHKSSLIDKQTARPVPQNSLTFSQDNHIAKPIIHYKPKASQCTITDFENVSVKTKADQCLDKNSVIICIEDNTNNKSRQHHLNSKPKTMINHQKLFNYFEDDDDNDDINTTQIYLTTSLDVDESNLIIPSNISISAKSISPKSFSMDKTSEYRTGDNCKFKRLSLTDSRKRRRIKNQKQVSIVAPSATLIKKDSNNNHPRQDSRQQYSNSLASESEDSSQDTTTATLIAAPVASLKGHVK